MDTWSAVGPTEMVLPMYDDSMENVLHKYLEGVCMRQWKELQDKDSIIAELKAKLDDADRALLAVSIQAAEAEDRADNEKRQRLVLVMRR